MSQSPEMTPPDVPPPRRGVGWLTPVLLLLAAGGGVAWWLTRTPPESPAPPPPADAGAPDAGAIEPPLQDSDPQVRNQLAGVASDPLWQTWLQQSDLVRRFAAAVQQISDGESPRASVPFLAPAGAFLAKEPKKGAATIDPRSYARYDAVARAVSSIDAAKAATAYRAIQPLLDRAWRELGPPGTRFDDVMAKAISRLVEVPVPRDEVEVVPKGALWAFKDESLEARTAAEKHLLRMGPDNMRRVQVKLRELQGLLSATSRGEPAAPPPGPRP